MLNTSFKGRKVFLNARAATSARLTALSESDLEYLSQNFNNRFIDEGLAFDVSHPFHMHGTSFYVVAMERHAVNSTHTGPAAFPGLYFLKLPIFFYIFVDFLFIKTCYMFAGLFSNFGTCTFIHF